MDQTFQLPRLTLPPPGAVAKAALPFAAWAGTLAVAIFAIGWSSTLALGLVGDYASETAAAMKLRPLPVALKTMLPVTPIAPKISEPVAVPDVEVTYAKAPAEKAVAPTQKLVEVKPKMIATLGLSVREAPDKDSARVAALEQGEIVDAGAARNGWVLVTTREGLSGWAWGKYLQVASPKIAADSPFWTE